MPSRPEDIHATIPAATEVTESTPQRTTPADGPALQGDQDFRQADCAATDDDRKALATLQAMAATAGCSLHKLDGGGYLVCRWGLSKELPDLRTVGDLLRRIGGAA